jgi:hypothetical protein
MSDCFEKCIYWDNFLIINWEEIGKFDEIEEFRFTSDSTKYIFKANNKWKRYIFNNKINWKQNSAEILSKKSRKLLKDGIEDIIFSDNWNNSAILFFQKNENFILYNKNKSNIYYRILDISFSKNWKLLAYKIKNKTEEEFLIINWKKTNKYYHISKYFHYKNWEKIMLIFEDETPKNQDELYIFKYTIIENWKKQKKYDYIDDENIIFSKYNNSYAYIAHIWDKEVIVKDWRESKEYDSIKKLFLSDNWEYFTAIVSENWKNILVNNFEEKYSYYGIYQYDNLKWNKNHIFLTNIDEINTNINRTIIKQICIEVFEKYKKKIDNKIQKLSKEKLNILLEKINKININNFNTIKYRNIFEYLKNKIEIKLEEK